MTQFEEANAAFIEAVRQIQAVILAVESDTGIDVVIPKLPSPTSTKV